VSRLSRPPSAHLLFPSTQEWIDNVRAGSFSCQGNHIAASSNLVAFNTDQAGGGMLGLTSVKPGSDGRWTVTHISCHSDLVSDMAFSPFDDGLLVTCSADETVKLWRLREPGAEQPAAPELTLRPGRGRLELALFHPTSSGLLAVGSTKCPLIWDTGRQDSPLAVLEQHSDQVQSLSWKNDGTLLASSCKDKMLRVFDPRAQLTAVQFPSSGGVLEPSASLRPAACGTPWAQMPSPQQKVEGVLILGSVVSAPKAQIPEPALLAGVWQMLVFSSNLSFLQKSAKGLQSNKDSRILWVKDDLLVTTGFDMMRCREVKLWDRRALNSSIGSISLSTSSGVRDNGRVSARKKSVCKSA
ncbi:Coronin-7, partial [Takifugu flavidus]